MIAMLEPVNIDLAGYCPQRPHYLQIRARINHLINYYMSFDRLSQHLTDLPTQFIDPSTRPWEPVNWQAIHPDQILGIDPVIFTQLLASAAEIEVPIRGYSQESWQYLRELHPQMAEFMGGSKHPDGKIATLGTWEKEERQHAPALSKIYQQLTGDRLSLKPNEVMGYVEHDDAYQAAQQHVMLRISTEWGAVVVYLWLIAHSTGALQRAIAQPFQDEVNHLAKFWGFSRWAFGATYRQQVQTSSINLISLVQHHQNDRTFGQALTHSSLGTEELTHAIELTFALMRVMVRLRNWNTELSHSFLNHLFGASPAIPA
jgi:hypothetical protein